MELNVRALCSGLALLALVGVAKAQAAGVDQVPTFSASARVRPSVVRLGEPVSYQGRVIGSFPSATVLAPEPDSDLTWGAVSKRVLSGGATARVGDARRMPPPPSAGIDTLLVQGTVQIFRTGTVSIPGLRFVVPGERTRGVYRLPMVRVEVISVLSAADSNADLRPAKGPLGAPWWERVPWRLVLLGLALLGLAVAAWVWLRRRRRVVQPAMAPLIADPAAEALSALAALRQKYLPERGRFADHAYHLTVIVRRFLEASTGASRPGDTTGELLGHLASATLASEDMLRLETLLRHWDRVKFARATSTLEEARGAEVAVEMLIRRNVAPVEAKVA